MTINACWSKIKVNHSIYGVLFLLDRLRSIKSNQIVLFIYDLLVVNGAYFFSLFLHKQLYFDFYTAKFLLTRAPYVTVFYLVFFLLRRLYDNLWKYMGFYEILNVILSSALGTMLCFTVDYACGKAGKLLGIQLMPFAVYVDAFLLICFFCIGIRVLVKSYRALMSDTKRHRAVNNKRILIIGAGDMGNTVLYEMSISGFKFGSPVAIVDDDPAKRRRRVRGIPVVGTINEIPAVVAKYDINEIIFCIPSASPERKKEIFKIAMSTGCNLKRAPNLDELGYYSAKNYADRIRKVDVLDLLSRPEVKLDTDVCKYLVDQTVLVTGGGGSIGSELCRQIARYKPVQIVIFDIYENNAYTLKNQLDRHYCGSPKVDIRIGSVRDIERLREVFEEFHPSSVFHAAAHKHVPLMEESPYEALKNNILGTYNTALCANEYGVKNFILLSTDKAVNPTNVMGATKRVCELIIQHFSRISKGTKFAAVRFGNVLGSNGSVIPLFKEQLEQGGPLTVTHPDITRYFMTIPEASQLVVQAGGLAKGGEIFVLDMGDPVKIIDLAENLIRLSGLEPYKDVDIQFTGLRPGEKLYEELSMEEELDGRKKTSNDKIFVTKALPFDDELLEKEIKRIPGLKPDEVRDFLKKLVPNYKAK